MKLEFLILRYYVIKIIACPEWVRYRRNVKDVKCATSD